MKNPLLDKEFLLKLDEARERETYVRLIALTIDEHPVETIEGRATQGSLNVDGKSAVRRTCNLSLVANEMNINEFYWGLNSKFKLEIGIKNKIDDTYPEIIWLPFGTYLISNFTTSQNVNNYTISISGKDKMCMLNGEIGGAITALSVDFGKEEQTNEKGERVIKSIPIKNIIREGVHQFGNEPFHNIVINDLDELGIILKEYRGDTPLYLFRHKDSDEFLNMTLDGDFEVFVAGLGAKTLKDLEKEPNFYFDLRNSFTNDGYNPTIVEIGEEEDKEEYYIAKIEFGDTPGYTLTDLTYSGDLVAAVGDSFTSVLDKIVQMLGSFEYFYDVHGKFIFQKKKTYVSTSWNNLTFDSTTGEYYGENAALTSSTTYSFEDSKLIQSFSNNPDLLNLRNDYSVWGTRLSATGKELPIHMRYAIDKKPYIYTQFPITAEEARIHNELYGTNMKERTEEECYTYVFDVEKEMYLNPNFNEIYKNIALNISIENNEEGYNIYFGDRDNQQIVNVKKAPIFCDWREIIYQMALDYRKYNHLDSFEAKLAAANSATYPNGKTGYEQYYIDMEGFWRQLYNPEYKPEYVSATFTDNINEDRYVQGYVEINQPKYENIKIWQRNTAFDSKGILVSKNGYSITDYYYVENPAINDFYYNCIESDDNCYAVFYDENKKHFPSPDEKTVLMKTGENKLQFPIETKYVRFTIKNDEAGLNEQNFYFKSIIYDINYEKYYYFDNNNNFVNFLDYYQFKDEDEEFSILYTKEKLSDDKEDNDELFSNLSDIESKRYKSKPCIDSVNLDKYVLYVDSEAKTRFIDSNLCSTTKDNIYIKQGTNTYLPVLDLFRIENITDEEEIKKEFDFYFLNSKNESFSSKIYIREKTISTNEDEEVVDYTYKEVTTIQELKKYLAEKQEDLYYTELKQGEEGEKLAALHQKFYIKKERDIKGKKLYLKSDEEDKYISFNNNIDAKIKQNNIYIITKDAEKDEKTGEIIKPSKVKKASDLLSISRAQVYKKAEAKKFVLLKELIKDIAIEQGITLYKVNNDKKYFNVKNYFEQMRNLYIKKDKNGNEKYERYICSPGVTALGEIRDNLPIRKILINYFSEQINFDPVSYWNYAVQKAPETLNFWIDFIDSNGELDQYSVPVVGNRPKPVNDSSVKAIYFRDTPNVLFVKNIVDSQKKSGYNYIQLQPGMEAMFITSSQGKSAKDVVEENLYKHGYCTESISATVIPIYYLEPNTRIFVRDDNSKINGEYILNSMSISLTYNGMMNISANKAVERILY